MSAVSPGFSARICSERQAVVANHDDAYASMGKRGSIGGARQIAQPAPSLCQRGAAEFHPVTEFGERAEDQPKPKPDAERREPWPALMQSQQQNARRERYDSRRRQPLRRRQQVSAYPDQQRPKRHGDRERHDQNPWKRSPGRIRTSDPAVNSRRQMRPPPSSAPLPTTRLGLPASTP